MPRACRKQSATDIYHITSRGVAGQFIFEDEQDHEMFLSLIERFFSVFCIDLFAWCLMGNHFHLLIKGDVENVSRVMHRLLGLYARYFNNKYERVGHLFSDRFFSEPVESESHLLEAIRYIHQNPLKAGLSRSCKYKWSSYGAYTGKKYRGPQINLAFVSLFSSVSEIKAFHKDSAKRTFRDIDSNKRLSNRKAQSIIDKKYERYDLLRASIKDRIKRNKLILELIASGLSYRQIQRFTGISYGVVAHVCSGA